MRWEIWPSKVCVFHLSVNQYCRENTLQNGSNFGSLPHPYTSISGWILPHVFLHYPKDPRNAFRWDLNILLNCGVPYPAVSCSACAVRRVRQCWLRVMPISSSPGEKPVCGEDRKKIDEGEANQRAPPPTRRRTAYGTSQTALFSPRKKYSA